MLAIELPRGLADDALVPELGLGLVKPVVPPAA